MSRRGFLRSLLYFLFSAVAVMFVYPLARFLAPQAGGTKGRKVTIKKDEVPAGSARDFLINGTPAILINTHEKGFVALSKVCTHLGCLVEYEGPKKRLLCPCHAGVYDLEGKVVSGPPPKPLQRFPLKVEGEEIVIG